MSIKKIFLRLLVILTYTGLFYIRIINQFVFALTVFACLFLIFTNTAQISIRKIKRNAIFLGLTLVAIIIAAFNTKTLLYNKNLPIYFGFWILYSVCMVSNQNVFMETFFEDRKFIIRLTKLWNIIILVCIFIPSCYSKGGFVAFTGAEGANGGNRLCPLALFMMTMVYFCMVCYRKKNMVIYSLPSLYVFFMSGSRTYFVVGCILFIILLHDFYREKRYFYLTIIPVILIGYYLINITTIGVRIEDATWTTDSYGDYWYVFTSGRSVFWSKMMKAYINGSWFNKLVGNGFSFTIDTGNHWGHNDFVEIICCYGLLGLGLYLCSFILLFKNILNKVKIPIWIYIFVIIIWCFNAFFNMFYTYLCAAISYPVLLYGISYKYKILSNDICADI